MWRRLMGVKGVSEVDHWLFAVVLFGSDIPSLLSLPVQADGRGGGGTQIRRPQKLKVSFLFIPLFRRSGAPCSNEHRHESRLRNSYIAKENISCRVVCFSYLCTVKKDLRCKINIKIVISNIDDIIQFSKGNRLIKKRFSTILWLWRFNFLLNRMIYHRLVHFTVQKGYASLIF